MPSLFSRARTHSTPKKTNTAPNHAERDLPPRPTAQNPPYDEFGRVNSRASAGGGASPGGINLNLAALSFSPAAKKDKAERERAKLVRPRTASSPRERGEPDPLDVLAQIPDGSFLTLNLDPPPPTSEPPFAPSHDYGYLSYERHIVLGLDHLSRLVDVVASELGTRCLTTPFIFSTLALDISSAAIQRLIKAFVDTCRFPENKEVEWRWREEARFAGPHELGMCLRWGLARVVRVEGGQAVRGLIAWDHYIYFRDTEEERKYPSAHFATLLPPLPSVLRQILLTLFSLLIRFTAHSSSSGHTPPTLSPLFGPLLFGLGPATLAFHHTYVHYLRAVNAMEHLLLAFIRWQDAPRPSLATSAGQEGFSTGVSTDVKYGSATSLGVPTRLKDWIRGYPAMLPFVQAGEKGERGKGERPVPRRGARTVRVVSVRRNVRMYSPDLVKTAASWAQRPRGSASTATPGTGETGRGGRGTERGSERGLAGSKEWERIAPSVMKLPPRYSEGYKKRMHLATGFHPDTGPGMSSEPSTASSTCSSAYVFGEECVSGGGRKEVFGLGLGVGLGVGMGMGGREGEDRFRNLTDLRWGEFELMGFGGLGADEKKLQFDLTEGARTARAAKRATLTWNDFSATGFTRSDAPLDDTLQFSTPLAHTISSWPTQNVTITKKLKKTQRSLPPFGWDTEPVMGTEEVIEEAFLDVFCDLVYGGGWMDVERGEETDRECNWALQWKPAATLNGRPYVVGHVPRSPSYREVEFEGLIRGNGSSTKVLSLSKPQPPLPPGARGVGVGMGGQEGLGGGERPATPRPTPRPAISAPLYVGTRTGPAPVAQGSKGEQTPAKKGCLGGVGGGGEAGEGTLAKKSRFRLPVPSPTGARQSKMMPAEYSSVDFETRLAGYSDDEWSGGSGGSGNAGGAGGNSKEGEKEKQERRLSKDDAWVDILVATHNRRMKGQEVEMRGGRARGLGGGRGGRSDPEIASQEVAQVLAGIRARSPMSDEDEVDQTMEPVDDMAPPVPARTRPRRANANGDGLDSGAAVEEGEGGSLDVLDDPDVDSVMSYPRRRMGYFDLHPERRPGRPQNEDGDDGEEGDEAGYGTPDALPSTRSPKATSSAPVRSSIDTMESVSDYAPTTVTHDMDLLPMPEFANGEEGREEKESGHSRAESMTLPGLLHVSPTLGAGEASGGGGKGGAQGRTAALIEMYREKEREKEKGGVMPSRLPVRSTSMQTKDKLPPLPPVTKDGSSPPPPPPQPESEPTPEVEETAEAGQEPAVVDPPPPLPVLTETGRESPGRYIHGAPLHNVLEEEEEE
ncbi:hypothetical protein SERLA73DRAFT_169698 [Serpula lacrymans var. lacrymans S7.3]|uniref:Meiotically up-regulated protein Msb1/Mug8 domain-containing protein n=1 Tax=Serpula lacrymans var. lacrymans (strain S7.3) TaxID=936435 RepID=F8Q2B8_SERL3|nr:hypothetical protein SERLA73DRAFT_169698 [Serpula lacrymans var. lacrymans S7.3]